MAIRLDGTFQRAIDAADTASNLAYAKYRKAVDAGLSDQAAFMAYEKAQDASLLLEQALKALQQE